MLGAHLLVQLLDAGQTVRATYRTASSLEKAKHVFSYFTDQVDKEFSKIQWVQADVREVSSLEAAFQNIEKVYHLAALVSFDTSMVASNLEPSKGDHPHLYKVFSLVTVQDLSRSTKTRSA